MKKNHHLIMKTVTILKNNNNHYQNLLKKTKLITILKKYFKNLTQKDRGYLKLNLKKKKNQKKIGQLLVI